MRIVIFMKHRTAISIPNCSQEDYEIILFHMKAWKKFLTWDGKLFFRKKDIMAIELIKE